MPPDRCCILFQTPRARQAASVTSVTLSATGEKKGNARVAFSTSVQFAQISDLSSLPISDGLRVTLKPHSSMMASLASAVSAPPLMSAPA